MRDIGAKARVDLKTRRVAARVKSGGSRQRERAETHARVDEDADEASARAVIGDAARSLVSTQEVDGVSQEEVEVVKLESVRAVLAFARFHGLVEMPPDTFSLGVKVQGDGVVVSQPLVRGFLRMSFRHRPGDAEVRVEVPLEHAEQVDDGGRLGPAPVIHVIDAVGRHVQR